MLFVRIRLEVVFVFLIYEVFLMGVPTAADTHNGDKRLPCHLFAVHIRGIALAYSSILSPSVDFVSVIIYDILEIVNSYILLSEGFCHD